MAAVMRGGTGTTTRVAVDVTAAADRNMIEENAVNNVRNIFIHQQPSHGEFYLINNIFFCRQFPCMCARFYAAAAARTYALPINSRTDKTPQVVVVVVMVPPAPAAAPRKIQ